MKFLPGAKVSKRVMIHTGGHPRGTEYRSAPTFVFWSSLAHVQMPAYPSVPWSNGLSQRNLISEVGLLLLALKGCWEALC